METGKFIMESFPQIGWKLTLVENEIRDTFIQNLVFNKTMIIPLSLVGYELILAVLLRFLQVHTQCSFVE